MVKLIKSSGFSLFLMLLSVFIPVNSHAADYKDGEIILKFKDGSTEESKERVHDKHGHKKLREIKGAGVHHLKVRDGATVEEAIQEYKGDPEVEYAEPNYKLKVHTIPSDPLLNDLWGFYNAGQTGGMPGADIKAFDAWSIAKGDGSVAIAVIDTGIDLKHQDLANNLWLNSKEFNGLPGVDDDGNGYIDDIYGIDALNSKNVPADDNGHGSHIAGIIGAEGNNAVGVVGVNWNVKVMACKFLGADGVGYLDGALECLNYIGTLKSSGANIVAINIAWGPAPGTPFPLSLYKAIKAQSDILFVMAAGNSGADNDLSYQTPSVYDLPNVISVASTDHNDNLAWFSNYGKNTAHIGAPGVNIMSTVLNGTYASESGTSMAAAHVAGLAGLIKSQDQTRSAAQIKALILTGGDSIAGLNGKTVTGKRISAFGSLSLSEAAQTAQATDPLTGNNSAAGNAENYGTKTGTQAGNGENTVNPANNSGNVGNGKEPQILGPGWFSVKGYPISPEESRVYFSRKEKELSVMKNRNGVAISALAADDYPAEIKELARALRYDPKLIYDYVHNKIDYVPYFGAIKGALLTYLDGSGNDFDQAALMVALLRESGKYNVAIGKVQYVYGMMSIPTNDSSNWLGNNLDISVIRNILRDNGIPYDLNEYSKVTLDRIWVKAAIGGTDYVFDPAFKKYVYGEKIDVGAAMGYIRSELMASAGGIVGTDYVQNINEASLRSRLASLSSNLVNSLKSTYSNKYLNDVLGGRAIMEETLLQYNTTLPFPTTVTDTWDEIQASYSATLRIQYVAVLNCASQNTTQQVEFDYNPMNPMKTADLNGKRLTLTYNSSGYPQLLLDGALLASGTIMPTPGCKDDLVITIEHPRFGAQSATFRVKSSNSYAIVSNFGGKSDGLIMMRQRNLDNFRTQGMSDDSEAVRGETLNIMGQTWLKEFQMVNRLMALMVDTVTVTHHMIGLMAQENSYYIDLKMGVVTPTSKKNHLDDEDLQTKASSLIASAFEHGILEQLMGSEGLSTIKVLHIANNTAKKVYRVSQANINTIDQFINYTDPEKLALKGRVWGNETLILPEDGKLGLSDAPGQWKGKGYISVLKTWNNMAIGMIIEGDYYGGYSASPGNISPPAINNVTSTNVANNTTPKTITQNITPVQTSFSKDPVDLAGGAFVYDNADLGLGGGAPLGLSFSRSYNSNLNLSKRSLGNGWTHNNDIYLTPTSDGNPVLGGRSPVDAASFIVALYASFDLLKSGDDAKTWVVSSLISKWAVDQTIDNAITVHLGGKTMEFIKLADGSFNPPPGITTQLIKNGDGTYSLNERFGTRIDFNSDKQVAKITDVDGNAMNFSYSGTILAGVTDAFGRTLTLGYVNDRIETVTDSTGRVVRFGYDANGDLSSYTDPENKVWGYGYNSHRMTTLTNPLTVTTATNVYDSQGRVITQTVPRKIDGVDTTAVYNFYFSGWRNQEVDPAGNATTYYYDEKGREYAVEDALANRVEKVYDGQNHVVSLKDPKGNVTAYEYNSQNNIKKATDALSNQTVYDYSSTTSPYSVSDITDSLNRKVHFEYDTKHHLLQTRDDLLNITNATYNGPKGFKDTATDGRNTKTTFTYDSYGNPYTAKTASHPAITYSYDAIGRMTGLTDQVSSATSFVYDKRNLLTTKTDPLQKTTGFTYYADGKLWTKTDRNNNTITYSYTKSGKLDNIAYPSGSTIFKYNNLDQLTTMQDSLGSTGYTYYANGKLQTITDPNGFTISYAYDAAGNLTELTYPGGKKVIYTYDAANRLKTVKIDWLNKTATYSYKDKTTDPNDSLTTFNGIVTTYTFDNAKRLTGISIPNVASYQFTEIDANGNRKAITQTEPLSPAFDAVTVGYSYNDKKNRLNSAGPDNFGYDFEGQLSSGYGTNYAFDYEHRLTAAGSNSYYYDGAGRRLTATRSGVTTKYIYDAAGNLLAEADGSGNITKYYIYGAGLLGMVTPAGDVYNYHYNATGSTVAMTDSGQAMVNKYAYDAFGSIANQVEGVSQPFKYVGQFGVMTEPNGFYYMRARYYDPNVGRFISEDPIGFDGGDVNVSVYVKGNPVLNIDPSGLQPPKDIPPGVDIAANVGRAENMGLFDFYRAVKTGGEWDYKTQGTYEDFGNYHYGVVGAAAGFSETTLKAAAGAYQAYSGTSKVEWAIPSSNKFAWGDDPNDQKWISEGIKDYKAGMYSSGCGR